MGMDYWATMWLDYKSVMVDYKSVMVGFIFKIFLVFIG